MIKGIINKLCITRRPWPIKTNLMCITSKMGNVETIQILPIMLLPFIVNDLSLRITLFSIFINYTILITEEFLFICE